MTIRDKSPDESPIVSLTVTLAPGTSVALVIELMHAIKGQPEVADIKWHVAGLLVPGQAFSEMPADREMANQIMWLLGQVSPV
jgi:hypothetical protein